MLFTLADIERIAALPAQERRSIVAMAQRIRAKLESDEPREVETAMKLSDRLIPESNAIYAVPSSRPVLTRFGWGVVITVCIAIYSAAICIRMNWHKADSERTFVNRVVEVVE